MPALCYSAGDISDGYLIFAAWPQISVCWEKNSRRSLPPPCMAPLNLQTQGHARNWTRGPEKSNLPVLALTLNFKWLHAVILLTAELLSETKELWHSFALSNCAFSAHLQIQHETWSAPKRRGDCAERKHAETSRRNIVGLSGRKDQMCGQVQQQLVWWTDLWGYWQSK